MKSPAKFWVLAIAAVLLLVVLGGWALHFHAKSSLARVKSQLVAAGEKLSVAENLPALVPDAENGAREFMDAYALLSMLPYQIHVSGMSILAPGRARCISMESNAPTSALPDLWPELRQHLRTNQAGLRKLRAALERPRLRFGVAYGTGFAGLILPHLSPAKSAAQHLSMSVLMDLRDGQLEEGLKDLRALVSIPARWRDEPLLISELVRVAILAIAGMATWEALQHQGWTEPQLAEMQKWWESIPTSGAPARAMSMERALLVGEFARLRLDSRQIRTMGVWAGAAPTGSIMDDLAEVGEKVVENPIEGLELFVKLFPRQWAWAPWNSYHDEVWALDVVEKSLRAARDWEAGGSYVEIEKRFQQAMQVAGEAPPQYLLSATGVASAYEKFLQKQAFAETQRRMVITAIAMRRHQLAHGAWPARLEELAPRFLSAVPLDPMDVKPLRYRRNAEGAPLLYSVGTNGTDDEGDPRPLTGNGKYWMLGRDIVWPQRASAEELAGHYREMESKRPANPRR